MFQKFDATPTISENLQSAYKGFPKGFQNISTESGYKVVRNYFLIYQKLLFEQTLTKYFERNWWDMWCRPQGNDWGCVCDLEKPFAYIYVRKQDYKQSKK